MGGDGRRLLVFGSYDADAAPPCCGASRRARRPGLAGPRAQRAPGRGNLGQGRGRGVAGGGAATGRAAGALVGRPRPGLARGAGPRRRAGRIHGPRRRAPGPAALPAVGDRSRPPGGPRGHRPRSPAGRWGDAARARPRRPQRPARRRCGGRRHGPPGADAARGREGPGSGRPGRGGPAVVRGSGSGGGGRWRADPVGTDPVPAPGPVGTGPRGTGGPVGADRVRARPSGGLLRPVHPAAGRTDDRSGDRPAA